MKLDHEIPYYRLWFHEVKDGMLRFTCFKNLRGGGTGAPEDEAREASAKILNLPETKIKMIPHQSGSPRPDPMVYIADLPELHKAKTRVDRAELELYQAKRVYSEMIRALEDQYYQNGSVTKRVR